MRVVDGKDGDTSKPAMDRRNRGNRCRRGDAGVERSARMALQASVLVYCLCRFSERRLFILFAATCVSEETRSGRDRFTRRGKPDLGDSVFCFCSELLGFGDVSWIGPSGFGRRLRGRTWHFGMALARLIDSGIVQGDFSEVDRRETCYGSDVFDRLDRSSWRGFSTKWRDGSGEDPVHTRRNGSFSFEGAP